MAVREKERNELVIINKEGNAISHNLLLVSGLV